MMKIFIFLSLLLGAGTCYAQYNSIDENLSAKLKDTTKFDPWTEVDGLEYKPALQSSAADREEQVRFLFSSGFPFSRVPNGTLLRKIPVMPKTFAEADQRYWSFIAKEANNDYLDVFRQNAAMLIIRTYLLKNPTEGKALQYYTKELLDTHCKNYGLLYLCLKQLKPLVGEKQVTDYRRVIANDPVTTVMRRELTDVQQLAQHDENKLNNMLSKAIALRRAKDAYYLRLINPI